MKIDAPMLSIDVPNDEKKAVGAMNGALMSLSSYVDKFDAALGLFDFCEQQRGALSLDNLDEYARVVRILSGWQMVAARDGAMTIYHIAEAMRGIRASFRDCQTLRGVTDHTQLRAATKMLDDYFPNLTEMRHAVAHSAELSSSLEKLEANSFSKEYDSGGLRITNNASAFVSDFLSDRTFTMSWQGQMLSYDLSHESAQKLSSVVQTFFSGFGQATKRAGQ